MFNYLHKISGHNAHDFDIQESTWALSISIRWFSSYNYF